MSRIERGGANPSLDAVQVLADAFDVDVVRLFIAEDVVINIRSSTVEVPFMRDGS